MRNPDAVIACAGRNTQAANDTAVVANTARSSHVDVWRLRPGKADIVKAGMTRPAMMHSTMTINAKPACSARSGSTRNHPSAAA